DLEPLAGAVTKLDRLAHGRHGVDAGIGDAAGEDRDVAGRRAGQRVHHLADLAAGEDRGDVELDAPGHQAADQRRGGFTLRVGDGDLDVDVVAQAAILSAWRSISWNSSANTSKEMERPLTMGRISLAK